MLKIENILQKNKPYIMQHNARFMASYFSNLVNKLSGGIHRIKCKFGHDDTNVKPVELNIRIATVFLNMLM